MAGHSKWKNIQHRKGIQDARKGKVFSKIIKEITVAVKTGGEDPEANTRLRAAIINAKNVNMPRDNIERAIKKAAGIGGEEYQEVTFECYGPDGAAIFVECTTDNKTRTVGNLRSFLNKYNGSLGKDGCLQFIFQQRGIITLNAAGIDEEDFSLLMIEHGAEDVEFDEGQVRVTATLENYGKIQKQLIEINLEPTESSLERIPLTMKKLEGKSFQTFLKLLEVIEDDDDVQKVYHNVEYDEQLMADN